MTQNNWNSPLPVPIASGGTNASSMSNTDGTVYYDGTSLATTPANDIFVDSVIASSSSTVEFLFTPSNYFWKFIITDLSPVTNGQILRMRITTDGGATWYSGGTYNYIWKGYNSVGTETTENSAGTTSFALQSIGQINTHGGYLELKFTPGMTYFYGIGTIVDTGLNTVSLRGSGWTGTGVGINGIQFFYPSGNIRVGNFYLYKSLIPS